jgi:hypothetical protein
MNIREENLIAKSTLFIVVVKSGRCDTHVDESFVPFSSFVATLCADSVQQVVSGHVSCYVPYVFALRQANFPCRTSAGFQGHFLDKAPAFLPVRGEQGP